MKVKTEATVDSLEVITQYLLPAVKSQGVDGTTENVKVLVQNKQEAWVEVAPEKVKFVFLKE